LIILAVVMLTSSTTLQAGDDARPARRVTRYDLATRSDLLLSHLVAPAMRGEVSEWTVLSGLTKQLGDWVGRFFEAQDLANIITQAFPVEGQPALKPVETLVGDCARTLGVEMPLVYVRNNANTRIYSVEASGRCHLVMTSSLLNLFEQKPDELKFVVGRELGHIKCGHAELRSKSYALLSSVQKINEAIVPDRYQQVVPLLAMGRLFTWSREAEFTADRAGLLSCGDPKVAYSAIMRLQHGLRADSKWIDPSAPDFDAQVVIRTFRDWQYQPFMSFVLYIKGQTLEHPYYQERLAMLKVWADSDNYRALINRREGSDGQLIEIVRIDPFELAPEGQTVDPYVIVTDGDRQILRTRYAPAGREAGWHGFRSTDKGVDQPRAFRDGQPL
jgi:Zn-dependent protease with chaperone function